MDIFTKVLWVVTIILFVYSIVKSKTKTMNSLRMAKGMMKNMVGEIIAILFVASPNYATKAVENSMYYVKEMVQIMPVIFIVTAVIETLIPKEAIINNFGGEFSHRFKKRELRIEV